MSVTNDPAATLPLTERSWTERLWRNAKRDRYLLLLVLPTVIYFVIFKYGPMYGALIAFQRFRPGAGILSGDWVGFKYFYDFFRSIFFVRVVRNTLLLSFLMLVFSFPIPIVFALLLNEVRHQAFKRVIQTVSYLPHFISLVVVVGLMANFLNPQDGIVNQMLEAMGRERVSFMTSPEWFRPLYVSSGVWQTFGWNSIIFLAALSSINPELYDSAKVDGANRWMQMTRITLPSIASTIVILLILQVGKLFTVGFQKIILMYNPATYEVADVIRTYVYRRGLLGAQYSFGAAVGLFESVLNFIVLVMVNRVAKKVSEVGLW